MTSKIQFNSNVNTSSKTDDMGRNFGFYVMTTKGDFKLHKFSHSTKYYALTSLPNF